jgi:hypothetical protein
VEQKQVSCGMNMENWVTQFPTIEITLYFKMDGGRRGKRLDTIALGKRMKKEKKNFKEIKCEIPVCKL